MEQAKTFDVCQTGEIIYEQRPNTNDKWTYLRPMQFLGPKPSLAYVEMRIILARMVFNFDMELDQPEKDWMDQEWRNYI
jgi:hypothetical protein